MKTYTLDYTKMKEKFQSFIQKDGSILFKVPLIVTGDTGKDFRLGGNIKALIPPEGYENTLMVINTSIDGMGRTKYHSQATGKLNAILAPYRTPLPSVSMEHASFVGVTKNEETNQYIPFIYEFQTIQQEPILIEKFEESYRYFFLIDGHYYLANADPLRDVASGKTIGIKEKLCNTLNNSVPFIHTSSNIHVEFPKFLFKDYAPITYYADRLLFDKYYRKNKPIILRKERKYAIGYSQPTDGYSTFRTFLYAFGDQYPECKNLIKTNDPYLLGEIFEEFDPDTPVTIAFPRENHIKLKDAKGVVTTKIGDRVEVKFMDYFKDTFSPKEIKKIE